MAGVVLNVVSPAADDVSLPPIGGSWRPAARPHSCRNGLEGADLTRRSTGSHWRLLDLAAIPEKRPVAALFPPYWEAALRLHRPTSSIRIQILYWTGSADGAISATPISGSGISFFRGARQREIC